MKIKIISLSWLFVMIFMSCKKEDPITNFNTASLYLSQIIIDKTPFTEYSYNSDKFINEEKGKFTYTINTYNDKNKLITAEYYANFALLSSDPQVFATAMNQSSWVAPVKSNLSGTMKYEYDGSDKLIKAIYTPTTGSQQSSEFTYDENDRINRQNLYWEASQVGYIEYSYDFKGNLYEENLYNLSASGSEELSTTTVYEYDTKPNPFKLISRLMIPGINTNNDNIIKETQTIHIAASMGGDIVSAIANSYTYNDKGYPVSRNRNVEYLYK